MVWAVADKSDENFMLGGSGVPHFHKLKQSVSLHTYISYCELLCRKYNGLGQLLNKMALQERRYYLWKVAKVKSQIVLNGSYRTYFISIKYTRVFLP